MANKYNLQEFKLLHDRGIFFDANVLIYLFWPTGQHFYEQHYAHVFRSLLRQKNQMYVDYLVISEVINSVVRIEFKKSKTLGTFKAYRNSTAGRTAIHDIYFIVRRDILNYFSIIGKVFQQKEIESFLQVEELDFVDKAMVLLCKENSLVLLTNDKDFKGAELDILTGNPLLLN